MKKIILLTLTLFCVLPTTAKFKFNSGGTKQRNYYSVIPYENVFGSLIVIKVEVAGKERRFLLDTGAPTCVSQELAKELNLQKTENIKIEDAEKKTEKGSACIIPEIVIGGVSFKNIPAAISKDVTFIRCSGVDGIIGSNLLRKSIVRFSHINKTITITDQPKKLDLYKKKKLATDIYLTPNQSSPYIQTNIQDNIIAGAQLLFDSGMADLYNMALNHFYFLKRHNVFADSMWVANGSNGHGFHGKFSSSLKYSFRVRFVGINNFPFRNVEITTTASDNSRIGAEFLQYGDITLDYKNKKFYFEPYTDEAEIDLFETRKPFAPNVEENKLIIGIIWEPSLLRHFNIGDHVLAINDTRFDNLSHCELVNYDFTSVFNYTKDKFEMKDKEGRIYTVNLNWTDSEDEGETTDEESADEA